MATLESAAHLILPRPGAPRRSPGRRPAWPVAATPRGAVPRRRLAKAETPAISGEQIDTWVLQGLIWLAMAGMVAWFHAPLGAALRSIF
jgi:hypothetical protein